MKIVVAACRNRGIGFKNKLPWTIKKEMNYFKNLTIGEQMQSNTKSRNAVVMGKNTWFSLKKPLPKRDNFILTTTMGESDASINQNDNVYLLRSMDEIKNIEKTYNKYDNIWIIGGKQIYDQFLHSSMTESIFYTRILDYYKCDSFFPDIPDHFECVYNTQVFTDNKTDVGFQMSIYQNKNINTPDKIMNVNRNILNLHDAVKNIK